MATTSGGDHAIEVNVTDVKITRPWPSLDHVEDPDDLEGIISYPEGGGFAPWSALVSLVQALRGRRFGSNDSRR